MKFQFLIYPYLTTNHLKLKIFIFFGVYMKVLSVVIISALFALTNVSFAAEQSNNQQTQQDQQTKNNSQQQKDSYEFKCSGTLNDPACW